MDINTIDSVEAAIEKIENHDGDAESFQLFLNKGRLTFQGRKFETDLTYAMIYDAVAKRGWESVGKEDGGDHWIYRIRTTNSE